MASTFWTNTVWYLALLAVSTAVLVVTFIKSPDRRLSFAFFFAVLGFTYCIELQLLVVFDAYTYSPKIVSDAFQDAVLGNHFSQTAVSSAAVMMSVLGFKKRWYFVFGVVFFLIDVLFAALGIYQLHWYMHIYTLFGFIAYSWLVGVWYNKIRRAPRKWIYYPTLFFGVLGAGAITVDLPLKLSSLQIFRGSFYDDMTKNHYLVSFIYAITIIILIIIIYESKLHLAKRVTSFVLLFCCLYFLKVIGVLSAKPGWFVPVALIDIFGHYAWTAVFSPCLKRPLRTTSVSKERGVCKQVLRKILPSSRRPDY